MGGLWEVIPKKRNEILRQRSRPYLFSNSLAPAIVGASIKVFELLEKDTTLRSTRMEYKLFQRRYEKSRFDIIDGDSAIVPVMLYDAKLSQNMADELLKKRHICNRFLLSCGP
jgi:glycine C-acetyltransferase